ncbi:MAG: tetratricopeptide repeat protein [Nitrospinota bacterium]
MRGFGRKLVPAFLFCSLTLVPLASAVGKIKPQARAAGDMAKGEEFSLLPGAGPLMRRALSLYFSGRLGPSLRAFQRAAEREEDYRSRFYLALVQFRLGRYQGALDNFNRALALGPSPSYLEPIRVGLKLTREQLSLRKARKGSKPGKGTASSALPRTKAKEPEEVSPAKGSAQDEAELLSRRLRRLTGEFFKLGGKLRTLRLRVRDHEEAMQGDFFQGRYKKAELQGMPQRAFENFLLRERRAMALWLLGLLEKRIEERRRDYNAYYPRFKAELGRREQRGKRIVEEGKELLSTPGGNTEQNRRLQAHNEEALEKVREQLKKLENYRRDYLRYLESAEADQRFLRQMAGSRNSQSSGVGLLAPEQK